jgi:hypothetical protein
MQQSFVETLPDDVIESARIYWRAQRLARAGGIVRPVGRPRKKVVEAVAESVVEKHAESVV